MDDDELHRRMAKLTYAAAQDLARKLGPAKSRVFWGYVEALVGGEIDTEQFGELLLRLRGNDKPVAIN
jgi:hypothetical protein